VAADTPCAGRAGRMKVMRGRVVRLRWQRGESGVRLPAVASRTDAAYQHQLWERSAELVGLPT